MEPLLPIRRRASQHPRRANRSPRGTRPSCKLTARPCAASQKAATTPLTNHKKNHQPRFNRNQQYSITAVSDGGGSVVERYAYSAYGEVTFADASGSVMSSSAIANRYTYTGREWDEGLSRYHYRARMYDAVGGRFVSRDPIGYPDGASGYLPYFVGSMLDPSGTVTVLKTPSSEVGHPWSNTPRLGAHVLGQTDANVDISYKCTPVTTVRFEGGGVGAGYYPARNVCVGCKATFTINVATEIKIDVTKIPRYAGHTTEGVYGHEQLHVKSVHAWAYRTAQSLSAFEIVFANCKDCERSSAFRADQEDLDFKAIPGGFLARERRHQNDSSPFDGVDYPPIGIMPGSS